MLCSAKEIEEKKRLAKFKLAKKEHHVNYPNFFNNSAGINNVIRGSELTSPNNRPQSSNFFNSGTPPGNPQPSTSFNRPKRVVTGTLSVISEDRFEVQLSRFSEAALNIFRLIPSKDFDFDKKIWSFHINDYDLFQSQMKLLSPDVVVAKLPNYVLKCCKTPKPDYSKICLDTIDQDLAGTLMPFQEEGVRFGIAKNGRCLIADDMGLGKTFQALGIASYYRTDWPLLIVTTSSMKNIWLDTIRTYLPSVLIMDAIYMNSARDYIGDSKIVVVSHQLMVRSLDKLLERKFGSLIIDESHNFKNPKTKCTIAAKQLAEKAKRVVLLSGTPALSRPCELYSQLAMINETYFGSYSKFTERYCDAKWDGFKWDASGKSNLTELEIILNKLFMIRRTKFEVLQMLPNKEQQIVQLDLSLNSLSETQGTYLNSLAEEYKNQQTGAKRHAALLSYFAETAKIKIPSVCSYILEILETSKKFIVFAHHKKMLNAIEQLVVKKNRKFIRIDGSTTSTQRKRFIDKFQEDDSYQCALLSTTAASVGITLTAAKFVVFAELHWNPTILNQAESRAHRIGQDAKVHVVYLLASGTADDYIWPMLKDKQKILQEVGLFNESFEDLPILSQNSSNLESIANDLSFASSTSGHTSDISYLNTPNKSSPNKRCLSDLDSADDPDNKENATKRRLSCVDKVDDWDSISSSEDIFQNISSAELDFLDNDFDEVLSNVQIPE